MLKRAPVLATAAVMLTLLGGCSFLHESIALSPQDAELTTLASSEAHPHRVAGLAPRAAAQSATAEDFIRLNETAAAALLATAKQPVSHSAPIVLDAPIKSAKGPRLDTLIYRHVASYLVNSGYTVADTEAAPASPVNAAIAATAAKPAFRISVQYTTAGSDTFVTLKMTDLSTNAVRSTYDYGFRLTDGLREIAVK